MNTFQVSANKRYIFIAAGLFVLLIPFSFVIISTILGGKTSETNTVNITSNITTNDGNTQQNYPSNALLRLPLMFHNVIPGKTTQTTVLQALGNPTKTAHVGEYTVNYYVTKGTYRYNIIILKKDLVQYIIEQKPTLPTMLSQYKKQTGKHEDGVLYDVNDDNSGVNLYTFAQEGIAFADDPDTNQTNQVHYFIPQTYQDFLLSEGAYLSFMTPPTN